MSQQTENQTELTKTDLQFLIFAVHGAKAKDGIFKRNYTEEFAEELSAKLTSKLEKLKEIAN